MKQRKVAGYMHWVVLVLYRIVFRDFGWHTVFPGFMDAVNGSIDFISLN